MSEEAKQEGMKRRVAVRIALLVFVPSFLSFCKLNFDLDLPDPSLNITAQTVYLSATDISIKFSFTAEEDKHLCRYNLAKNNGASYTVVQAGEEEFIAGQVYELNFDISTYGEGHYKFSFAVLVNRNGYYEVLSFLQDSIVFWIDETHPTEPVSFSEPGGYYNSVKNILLDHPELDTIDGSPVQIFYTTNEIDPDSDAALYTPGTPIPITTDYCLLKAVAIDMAGHRSGISSETYYIDQTPPIAPNKPATTDDLFVNKDEVDSGFEVVVGLGASDAVTGDELELLLDNSPFPSPLTHDLTVGDIAAGSYTFTVQGAAQLGADGSKLISARVTDMAGNPGSESLALNLTQDTVVPFSPIANPNSGTYNSGSVTLDHAEWIAPTGGTAVGIYYTRDGSTPDDNSFSFPATPIDLPDNLPYESTDLRAVAIDDAGNASGELTESYVIDTVAPADPSMDHSSDDYSYPFDLVITHSEIPTPLGTEVEVYYTIGSFDSPPPDPDPGSSPYSAPIMDIDANTIVKAIAFDQAGNVSNVVTETYTFLRIDSLGSSSCSKGAPINNSILYGFFFDYTAVDVYLSDGSSSIPCYPYLPASSSSELHIQILGTDLEDMATGPGTLTVVNRNNDDSVSTPFTIID